MADQAEENLEIEPGVPRKPIAVLPLDSHSDKPEDEFFAEGIPAYLLTNFARIGPLSRCSDLVPGKTAI